MKQLTAILCCAVLGLGTGFADEFREFTSADGSKSFRALLMEFNTSASTVKVRSRQGKIMSFKLSLLSTEDQEYVKERGPALAAAKGLRIDTDMNRKSLDDTKAGTWICEKTEYSYDVAIENTLAEHIEGAEFEYSIFIERERRDAEKRNEIVTGNHSVSTFLGHGDEFFSTSTVVLESWSDNPPIPKGGGGGGGGGG